MNSNEDAESTSLTWTYGADQTLGQLFFFHPIFSLFQMEDEQHIVVPSPCHPLLAQGGFNPIYHPSLPLLLPTAIDQRGQC